MDVRQNKWHIIFNNSANEKKNGKALQNLQNLLDKYEIINEIHIVANAGEGISTTCELCKTGVRHFVAAGGDGTINEVVNGIFQSGIDTNTVFLAVLPLGRGNDWVRTHNYPDNLEDVVKLWLSGKFIQHDVGLVDSVSATDEIITSRYFLNIAGFGFDADVIYNVTYNPPHFLGFSVYILSLIKTLLNHKPTQIQVINDNKVIYEGKVFMVISAIGKYNGGGICEAKYAIPDDGLFDLIIVPELKTITVLKHLKDMFKGDHIDKINSIIKLKTAEFQMITNDVFRGETEGELLKEGNYKIKLHPNSLNVLSNFDNKIF